ncbi:triple tyrosine motif-containing protein [Pontibacter oryzae]|uniref:Transcriptional regulator n=1 Tax=Pontibacter oryzae TaxID=2304593 RepID=A0A399RYJ1_9BACT|nr:triple tyrosine motif-containing protein [Pontibacter oryzae]RIJ34475.1 transcriptional regulator [Pontibacter oryzae]
MKKVVYDRFILPLVLLLFSFGALGNTVGNLGYPYIQNYTKAIYQAGNQNWSVAQGKDGVMYYGNSNGLLAYDGNSWELFQMPNKLIVRSVATDKKGRVYAGGFGEMGYWSYDKQGRFNYTSLVGLVPEEHRPKDEIWKIYADGDKVYFQSFASIFIYQAGKIKVVKASQPYLFLLKAGNRYFADVIGQGLFELKNDSLHRLNNNDKLANTRILTVLPFTKGRLLIGTARHGIYIYDGVDFTPWQNEADNYLRANQLNNGAKVNGRYYAFGTILNGVVILDESGQLVHKLNKNSGLQNNTVLNLYTDSSQNLWVGLDNGVDRVEINSPLYFYFDKVGTFGTVYSSTIHEGKIYLGTNQGLFYSKWNPGSSNAAQNLDFQIIENSQGQVWELTEIDGELLCGHNEGTFRVEGSELVKISDLKGGWTIKKLPSDPTALIQGTYTGLAVYRKDKNGHWAYAHKVSGFGEPSKNVEQDNAGNIWVSHAYKGLFKLSLSPELKKVTASKSFDKADGLPGNYKVNISRLYNSLLFSSDAGFYLYNELSGSFSPYDELNSKIGKLATSNRIIPATGKKHWFINHGKVALVDLADPQRPKVNTNQFSILDGRMVQEYESISKISDAIYLISIDDGFVIYNTQARAQGNVALPSVLIRKVENTTDQQQLLSETGQRTDLLKLPYSQNNIRFTFALPYFKHANVQFQYLLEGYSDRWSPWSTATQKEFTNLSQGKYTFSVRARINGEVITEGTLYHFAISPPWYATWWAYVCYALLVAVLLWLGRRFYYRKLQRDQQQIQRKLEEEKQEQLRQEAMLHEQKLVKLRNEQLKSELSSKSRELASTALNIVNKNELLQNISTEVNKLQDSEGNRLPEKQLKKIQKIITEGMSSENDWDVFEKSFNETNANYFKKLKEDYPELTPNDLKLCAYLRMNMCSKEIASLLNITVRGVELRRYRLRKKLNMDHDKNLVEFVMEI